MRGAPSCLAQAHGVIPPTLTLMQRTKASGIDLGYQTQTKVLRSGCRRLRELAETPPCWAAHCSENATVFLFCPKHAASMGSLHPSEFGLHHQVKAVADEPGADGRQHVNPYGCPRSAFSPPSRPVLWACIDGG